jgi:hypothetical protein
MSDRAAKQVRANGRRWWNNSAMKLDMALPNKLFDKLGAGDEKATSRPYVHRRPSVTELLPPAAARVLLPPLGAAEW